MSDKARVVFDTNVLISALLIKDSTSYRAFAAAEQSRALVTSTELLAELAKVLERQKFDRYIDRWTRLRFIARVQAAAAAIVPDPDVRVARDPKDDVVLATAKAGQAAYLVTGDDDLLSLASFAGTAIVRPADFLRQFAEGAA